jgi:hypothetical protein
VATPKLTPEQQREVDEQAAVQKALDDQKASLEQLSLLRGKIGLFAEFDMEQQATELTLCKSDIFYWINTYVWIYEPRSEPDVIPFKLFDYQREDIAWILENVYATIGTIQKRDLLIEKSRGIGWSWLVITVAVWFWLFYGKTTLFGSRKAEVADKLGDLDSLLEKARFIIRRLPEWQLPKGFKIDEDMTRGLIKHPSGAAIAAESSNPNFGRAGRKLFTVFDEFASWPYDEASAQAAAGATNCRIFISTPNGPFNAFAQMARWKSLNEEEQCGIKPDVRRRHWSEHPIYGAATRKDPTTGTLTSPWYREEAKRYTPDGIAAELDINYIASQKGLVFPGYVAEVHRQTGIVPDKGRPIMRIWDPGNDFFVLWMQVDKWGRVLVLDEFHCELATIRDVANAVILRSNERFPGFAFEDYGDPHGTYKQGSGSDVPEFEVLRDEFGLHIDCNAMDSLSGPLRVKTRITAIRNQLQNNCTQTRTASLLIDYKYCRLLDRALLEGYRYKIDKFTKRVWDVVDEEHPWEDAVDCLGIGIVSKLGLAVQRQPTKALSIKKNVIYWPGSRRK